MDVDYFEVAARIERGKAAEFTWWSDHYGQPDALVLWLSDPECIDRRRRFTRLVLRSTDPEHDLHQAAADVIDWYASEVFVPLCLVSSRGVQGSEVRRRALWAVAVLIGLTQLKGGLSLRMNASAIAAMLLRVLGARDHDSSAALVLRTSQNDDRWSTPVWARRSVQEPIVRALYDAVEDRQVSVRSLDDVRLLSGVSGRVVDRAFLGFEDFICAESRFEDDMLQSLLSVTPGGRLSPQSVHRLLTMLGVSFTAMLRVHASGYAAALGGHPRLAPFFGAQAVRRHALIRDGLDARDADSASPSRSCDYDSLILHAALIGVSRCQMYFPQDPRLLHWQPLTVIQQAPVRTAYVPVGTR